jgi:hypothetical protein
MELTAQNVQNVVMACLYSDEEVAALGGPEVVTKKAVIVEGVVSRFGFNPEKLEKNAENIKSMLDQLPETFKKSKGGGMSFLNACVDKDGRQWGEHRSIDELLCLGIAIKKAEILAPKEMWPMLPGGMPYIGVEG